MNVSLTERDHDLLETLTCRVAMLTTRHIAALWWPQAAGHAHNAASLGGACKARLD